MWLIKKKCSSSRGCPCSLERSRQVRSNLNSKWQWLTSSGRNWTPATMAMLKDKVPQPLVLIWWPQPFLITNLWLLTSLAPHYKAILRSHHWQAFRESRGVQKNSADGLLALVQQAADYWDLKKLEFSLENLIKVLFFKQFT